MEYQSCSGDSEAFLRGNQPAAGELILNLISLEYADVVMAAATAVAFGIHGVMWLLAGFIINHVYSGWLMDIKERNGTMSGIFSGDRYIVPEDL